MVPAAVFLDLGGTLIAERGSRAGIYAEEARALGLEVSEERMRALMASVHARMPRETRGGFRYSDAWFRAFQEQIFAGELGLEATRLAELSERLFARFEDPRTFALFPGARELLLAVRGEGVLLGLISNWSERLTRLLEALDLSQAFDFVLGSADLRLEKPDPAIFRAALRRAGLPPERCLHAGDDVRCDVLGALEVGISAVLVDHHGRSGEAARGVCPVVRSLPELQDRILGGLR